MQRLLVGLLVACECVVALAQEPAVAVRVGTQGVSQPRLIDFVMPWTEFGSVVSMDVTISPQGLVSDVRGVGRVSPGEPLGELEQGIVDVVRRWRFEPTVMNGAAVSVMATVTVNNRAWRPSPAMLAGTPSRVNASLTVNINRGASVLVSGAASTAAPRSAGPDSTMPADFAVQYFWMCGPPSERFSVLLTMDTTIDEGSVRGGRVRLGVQTEDLERMYVAMRDGGTFGRSYYLGWTEPMPSGMTTVVRPDGVEVTVNYVSAPIFKNTVPWMAEYGWNLDFRLNGVWRRSANGGFLFLGTQKIDPPSELPILLDLLDRSDDVKRLAMPLPRACP
jgi:hypothetical protein